MAGLEDRLGAVVGGRTAGPLEEHLGLATVADLLQHYPRRYARSGELTELDSLEPGDYLNFVAEVVSVESRPFDRPGRKRGWRLTVAVTDGRNRMRMTWFNQKWREKSFTVGRRGFFSGVLREYRGQLELTHPEAHMFDDTSDSVTRELLAAPFFPIYPATKDCKSITIAQAVSQALALLDPVPDHISAELRARRGLISYDDALRAIHRPESLDQAAAARRRLAYDEALVLQVVLAQRRHSEQGMTAVARPGDPDGFLARFDAALPYPLTRGQQSVGAEISRDLAEPRPMHRLLQGDVGSGKTLVALRAMLQVVDSGGQAVLLAPTEVLAQQHHASLTGLLGPIGSGGLMGGTSVALLTGSMSAAARRRTLLEVASGDAGIVVGTHALLEPLVQYADLGLIVVDEQHRFGVEQRSALLERVEGQRPHLLVMTATPIPRTVAMTVFGDLDTSVMRDRPGGAPKLTTHVVAETDQPAHVQRAWERVVEEVRAGGKVFVVCSRIDESDADDTSDDSPDPELFPPVAPHAVTTLAPELAHGPLAGLRVGVLHGRLAPDEKESVMARFTSAAAASDALDVIVSTTVIEVGVDVPQASMMVIMDADRFGVSQLHQLRGRVGRAGQQALCLFVTRTMAGTPARERLAAIAATTDGFALARLDLEQRREGDVLGALQSGRRSSLRLLSVLRDEDTITAAREDATALVAADPALADAPGLARQAVALAQQSRSDYLEKT